MKLREEPKSLVQAGLVQKADALERNIEEARSLVNTGLIKQTSTTPGAIAIDDETDTALAGIREYHLRKKSLETFPSLHELTLMYDS